MAVDAAAVISSNLARVRDAIDRAADGREVHLVCVTKYAEDSWLKALLEAGAADFGENLLPRAGQRFDEWLSAGYTFRRHLLGVQQTRKAKLIPAACDLFQALDRVELAEKIAASLSEQGYKLDVLLEVNADEEPQKSGWTIQEAAKAALRLSAEYPALNLRGLMAVPRAKGSNESGVEYELRSRTTFAALRAQFDRIAASLPRTAQWDTLSMGMSQDFTWAIAEGSTMVRVGSALFAGLEG